jgi:hypothetical protein
MVWAISSGRPTRPSGTVAAKLAFFSGVPVKRSSIPVSMGPWAARLMRTPDAAASSADGAGATVARRHHPYFMLHAEQCTQDIDIDRRSVGFCGLSVTGPVCPRSSTIDSNVQMTKVCDA